MGVPAFAATPGNDTRSGATVVGTGFTAGPDTTGAGTDADAAALDLRRGLREPGLRIRLRGARRAAGGKK